MLNHVSGGAGPGGGVVSRVSYDGVATCHVRVMLIVSRDGAGRGNVPECGNVGQVPGEKKVVEPHDKN